MQSRARGSKIKPGLDMQLRARVSKVKPGLAGHAIKGQMVES